MRKFTQKILVAAVTLASTTLLAAPPVTMRSHMLLSARMDGAQQTPSVSGSGTGISSFVLNSTRDTLCINATFANLTGPATGIHIHSGALGASGAVLVDLTSNIVGNRVSATITGTILTALLKSNMLKGLTYLNLHTAANPGGEIRGQIYLESDVAYTGGLDGAQSVPSVSTAANGYAVFNMAKHQGTVKFYVVVNGLSGAITSAHLHFGAAGVAGGVAQDLSTFVSGNTISGAFTPSAGVTASLNAGSIYINVHTTANPGGEIRGQLKMDDKIGFDAWFDGAQSTPTIATGAKGVASFKLNTTFDTLWFAVNTNSLSGAISSAHLHNGALGVAGSVALDMSPGISGNKITGFATGTVITTALINNMLTGNIYANIHTAANPGGEIRGQVYRVMREGFTYSMDGTQQSPAVVTNAKGSGIVSINRDQDNAHFMLVTAGASVTSIHFHKAIAGAAGPVIDDLTTFYSNYGAFGYWKSTDASPFTIANSTQFNSDSVYVNAHTAANPGGEIRGQVKKGFNCYTIAVGINEQNISENGISIYPNPAKGSVNIMLAAYSNENVNVIVMDLVGKIISSNSYNCQVGENKMNVDLKNATAGMYFIKISNGKNVISKKLIVE